MERYKSEIQEKEIIPASVKLVVWAAFLSTLLLVSLIITSF